MTCSASNICCFHSLLSNYLTCFDITRPIYWKSCPQPCFRLALHLFSHCWSFGVSFRPCSFPLSPPQQNLQSSCSIQTEIAFLSSRSIPTNAVLPKYRTGKSLCFWNVNLPTLNYLKPIQTFGIRVQIVFLISVANTYILIYKILSSFWSHYIQRHLNLPGSLEDLRDICLIHSLPGSLWVF